MILAKLRPSRPNLPKCRLHNLCILSPSYKIGWTHANLLYVPDLRHLTIITHTCYVNASSLKRGKIPLRADLPLGDFKHNYARSLHSVVARATKVLRIFPMDMLRFLHAQPHLSKRALNSIQPTNRRNPIFHSRQVCPGGIRVDVQDGHRKSIHSLLLNISMFKFK